MVTAWPMVMPTRAALGSVPDWQLGLAVALVLSFSYLVIRAAARVYRGATAPNAGAPAGSRGRIGQEIDRSLTGQPSRSRVEGGMGRFGEPMPGGGIVMGAIGQPPLGDRPFHVPAR